MLDTETETREELQEDPQDPDGLYLSAHHRVMELLLDLTMEELRDAHTLGTEDGFQEAVEREFSRRHQEEPERDQGEVYQEAVEAVVRDRKVEHQESFLFALTFALEALRDLTFSVNPRAWEAAVKEGPDVL